MSQHERWYASARLFTALGLIAAVIWIGNAQAASISGAARATAAAQTDVIPPACRHDQTSEWSCPEDARDSRKTYRWSGDHETYDDVIVTYTKGKFSRTVHLGSKVDAVFLSKYAMENFLLRYYNKTNKDKAKKVRQYVKDHS